MQLSHSVRCFTWKLSRGMNQEVTFVMLPMVLVPTTHPAVWMCNVSCIEELRDKGMSFFLQNCFDFALNLLFNCPVKFPLNVARMANE